MKDQSVAMSKTMDDGVPLRLIVIYFAIFLAVLYLVFSHNVACLSMSQDGVYWLSVFKAQASRRPFSQLGVDPLQGNFDAYLAVGREYFAPEALALLFTGGQAGKIFSYIVYGVMMVLSTYALGRVLDFSRSVAFSAGAAYAAIALPTTFSDLDWLYPIYNLAPPAAQAVCCATLIITCFWAIAPKRPVLTGAVASAALALTVLCAASNIAAVSLLLPAIIVYGGASFFSNMQRPALLSRAGLAAACIGVPAALGMAQYAIVIGIYTAYYYFGQEFMQLRASSVFASIFFQDGLLGKVMIVVGLISALYAALWGPRKVRTFAFAHIIATILYLPASYLVVEFADSYHGPSPLYFEFAIWPIIVLFDAYAIIVGVRGVVRLLSPGNLSARPLARIVSNHGALIAVPLFLVCWNGWALAAARTNSCAQAGFFPIRPNAITDHLQSTIALKADRPFRGLVATFAGVQGKDVVDWISMEAADSRRSVAIGSDLRTADLWFEGIPTLMQYSPLITPPYYLVLTEFLSRPTDKQVRNGLVLTQPNEPMLRLWGVRFLIADFAPGFGETKAQLAVPREGEFRLVELPAPNLGDYSPTRVEHAANFRDGLILMKKPDYDGRSTVVTDAALQGPLVGASDVKLVYRKTGFTLSAVSTGRSILVLPIQYSRCWSVSGKGDPFLFRANLMQLGIGFTGTLDAALTFRFGPFFASGCRLQDIRDMDRLQIRSARTR